MKCSRCQNESRPNQRTCRDCHAENERDRRAQSRNRLVRIESLLVQQNDELAELREAVRKAPHRIEPTTTEARRLA
jgi:uncharacterized OB-fold protein